MGGVTNQVTSAYYYTNGGSWQQTGASLTANQKVSALGFKEGDTFTAGIAFIPEYYEDGVFDKDSVKEVLESGKLGEGAYFANTFTVDDTAPEIKSVTKDLLTGAVTITAQDNQYVAALMVYKGIGNKLLAGGVPVQEEAGETCGATIALDETAGEYIKVVVADYAGNETTYKVYYGGTPEDFSGRMFGFTSATNRGNGNRWVEVDVENLSKTEGLTDYEEVDYDVYAADYIGKYVFFATLDGIYAAPQEGLSETSKVASFDGVFADGEQIADMAYNQKDGKLYFLTNFVTAAGGYSIDKVGNTLYTVDYVNGDIAKVADITVDHPTLDATSTSTALRTLAIDNDGNFYSVNDATNSAAYLFKWTAADVADGKLTVSAAFPTTLLYSSYGLYVKSFASMAYDHDKNVLYLVGGYGAKNKSDVDNELWVVDTATGTAAHPNTNDAQFYDHTVGVYVVPSNTVTLPKNVAVTKVEINKSELTVLKGSILTLEAAVYPWLAADKSVTWATSDAETVSVDQNGEIKALKVGTAYNHSYFRCRSYKVCRMRSNS